MQEHYIPGVTQPYLYVGVWRSLFGWHKEDVDLYSINYLHHGRPKFWYSIDLDCNEAFESLANAFFKDLHKECPEFLRHKTTLIEPRILLQNDIKMHKLVQREREFVISRTKAYHSGFNSGFNIAEAVNFALPSWVPIGKEAGYCKCVGDSVKIDMDIFERRLKGEVITDEMVAEQKERDHKLEVIDNDVIKMTFASRSHQKKVPNGDGSAIL
jgi:[histone H3]-trimethyl-L-lysine9/36 demethylase